jgi:hypothetical protein
MAIAENIGHLITFEIFIARAIAKAIKGLVEPYKKSQSFIKEPIVLGSRGCHQMSQMVAAAR